MLCVGSATVAKGIVRTWLEVGADFEKMEEEELAPFFEEQALRVVGRDR